MVFNLKSIAQNECMKIILFVIWLVINAMILFLSYRKYCYNIEYVYLRKMLKESICISRATAAALYFNCFLVLLPICKSLLSWLRGLIQKYIKSVQRRMFNYNVEYHIILGVTIIIYSVIHALSHCANCYQFYINFSEDTPELNISSAKKNISIAMLLQKLPIWTGISMLLILAILAIGSLPVVRRSRYEIFWISHHLSLIFLVLLIFHGFGGIVKHQTNVDDHYPACEFQKDMNYTESSMQGKKCIGKPEFAPDVPQAWKWLLAPLIIYAIEKLMRYLNSRKKVQVTKVIIHPGDIMELRMRKQGFTALPGQYIRLNCARISKFQWHPFTLTECPVDDDEEFAVHIKMLGDWTGLLASLLNSMVIVNETAATRIGDSCILSVESIKSAVTTVPVDNNILKLEVDGPYGSPFQDISRFSIAVIVTAGIGVTPFAAVLNQMRNAMKSTKTYGKLKRLYFLWVCKTHDDFTWFLDILYKTNKEMNTDSSQATLTTRLFVTRSRCLSQVDPSFFDERKEWLHSLIRYSRPNWSDEFSNIDAENQSQRIGVFFCGPKTIHPTLHWICNQKSPNKNTFVFHKENF